jgi:ABC-type branched-subunit amino acid transport system substrate-binding protein
MRFFKRILFFCTLLLLSPDTLFAEDITIGMSAAFTGASKDLGIDVYRGAAAYIEHVNRSGGVRGKKITIKGYDDGYNPNPAIQNTIKLIEKDRVLLLFGYVGTPTVTRVLPLLKNYSKQSVYLLFPLTGAQPHRQPPYYQHVFNLRASYEEETAGLVEHFLALGRKRIAVFYQADAYGRSGWEGVRKALAKNGGLKISAEATYQRGTIFSQSLNPQVDILKNAAPDAIISIGAYSACAAFIRDARDKGWQVPIANVSFVGSQSLAALLNESSRVTGKDYTQSLINSQVVPSYEDTSLPAVREYRELMDKYSSMDAPAMIEKDYNPSRRGYVNFEGFLNAKLLVEIIKRMGSNVARGRIKEITESIKALDLGIGAPISFNSQKHQGSDQIYYTTLSDGRFVPLASWERWKK